MKRLIVFALDPLLDASQSATYPIMQKQFLELE